MIKKNNKGFTLIEVIAVVALLGILAVFAVPRVYDLVTNSRNRVYVEDAIRLIAQARYSMNAKSVKIEKPDIGESIVFSMKYLSSGDFQNPPNGGSYLTESSFVVVKNISGDYAYSTMLVEKTAKGQYIGVELSTENALNAKDAIKHVRTFSVSELGYVDEDESIDKGGKFVNSGFVNENLNKISNDGNWNLDSDDIIGYYNNEIDDPDVIVDTSSPKVTAKFSTSGSLQTVLSVYATDSDNVTSELRVFVKVSNSENDTYPNPNTDAGEPYGNEGFYSKDINFADYGFSYDNPTTAYVYILVADPNNNYTRKRMTYDIHENEAPVIKLFSISQLTNKDFKMPSVKVALTATDDMDKTEDLFVCFAQDSTPETCSPYKKYSNLFGNTGSYTYTFKNSRGDDITVPDGSSHTLTVYVKDSLGLTTHKETSYQLYNNAGPNIVIGNFGTSCAYMKNGVCQCNGASCNSLTAVVNLNVTDDITDSDDVKLKIYHTLENDNTPKGIVETTFGQFRNSDQKYTFSGGYDGKARTIYIEATDEYGVTNSASKVFTGVYEDSAPSITVPAGRTFITSAEDACDGISGCRGTNSYNVNLNFQVEDDITNTGDLKVCVSERRADCESNKKDSNTFVKYSEFDRTYEFSHDDITNGLLYPNPAITKNLYAAVVDGKGNYKAYNTLNPIEYTLYNNHKPDITGSFGISSTSSEGGRNLRTVKINTSDLEVLDDFEKYTARFCYYINAGDEICTPFENFNGLKNRLASFFEYTDSAGNPVKYTGQEFKNYFEVKDNYGETDKTEVVNYKLFADQKPRINSFVVKSINDDYNSNIFNATFDILDYEDSYSVCVAPYGTTCRDEDYVKNTNGDLFDGEYGGTYTIEVNGQSKFGWSESYEESNLTKTLVLHVKDTNGQTETATTTYTLYELCSTTDSEKLVVVDDTYNPTFENGREISASACQGMCFRHYITTNNATHINYETKTNEIKGNYKKKITYSDNLVNNYCDKYQEVELMCDYVDCFVTGNQDNVNTNVIGMKLIDENKKWYYSNNKVRREVLIDKPYCENPGTDAYFYPGDSRCSNIEDICDAGARAECSPTITAEYDAVAAEINAAEEAYETELAAYNQEYVSALEDYLLTKYDSSYDSIIHKCTPHELEIDSIDTVGMCTAAENCTACKNHTYTVPDGYTEEEYLQMMCTQFDEIEDVNACQTLKPTGEQAELCDLAVECSDFEYESQHIRGNFRDSYLESHPEPVEPYVVFPETYNSPDWPDIYADLIESGEYTEDQIFFEYDKNAHMATCVETKMPTCRNYYNFCNAPFTSYKKRVNCDEFPDITPIYCRSSDTTNGLCLENDNTCTSGDTDCQKVCYQNYNCQDEYEIRPVVFTCNGYYKAYQAKSDGTNMTLQEMPLKVCPDFIRLFPAFSEYKEGDPKAYIRFNPDEIG